MESKTKKTTDKSEIIIKNQKDYTDILNKIFYALIIIAIICVANLFVNIIKNGSVASNDNTQNNEEELGEYDVSMFNKQTTTEAMASIAEGGTKVVYIGRSTCSYCVKFLPILQQAQSEYGYTTTYIDLTEMTSDDQTNLLTLDNEDGYIEENLGYTPMVLIFRDGQFVNGWVGYAEFESFASFLEENGI